MLLYIISWGILSVFAFKSKGGEFCEINISKEDGEKRIKIALSDMMELIYSRPK